MFFRKLAQRTAFLGWLIAVLAVSNIPASQAAPEVLFGNAPSSSCTSMYSADAMHGNRFIALTSLYITNIDVYIGTGSQTNFSTSRFLIMSDNPNTNIPAAILETFTPTTISGSGMSTLARYSGGYAISAGTKFWIVNAQGTSLFPWCYINGASATSFTMNGMIVDTTTSLSNTSFRRVYVNPSGNPASVPWTTTVDGYQWQIQVSSTGLPPVVATLGTQSGSLNAVYRTVTPLTVNVNTQSKVTFYSNGKYIAGCRNILSSGGTATCNWKPSVHGSYRIFAVANPISSSYLATNTATISIGVVARTNKR